MAENRLTVRIPINVSKDKPTPTLTTLNEGWSHTTQRILLFSCFFSRLYIDRKTEKPANNHVAVLVTVKRYGV